MELRDERTESPAFRRAANRISVLLAAEALRDVPSIAGMVTTPLGPAAGDVVRGDVVVVPVLRAGLGMLDAVLELLPHARVGHIGLQRDELTAVASQYYSKLPADLRGSARGHRACRAAPSRCAHLHAGRGSGAQRPQVHRAGPGRFWRQVVWYGVRWSGVV